MKFTSFIIFICFISTQLFGNGLNVFGIGVYDVKFDGSATNQSTDFRYERRIDKTLFDIGNTILDISFI